MGSVADFAAELRRGFAGDIRLDPATRILYSTDASIYQIEPLGVVLPRTQQDLQASVELAAKHDLPILARGAGTSLAGQAIARAVIVDCSRWLDHILEIRPEERLAVTEPGVVLADLNRAASRYGLQFGPDPASAERATMAGVIANNSTGAHSVIYGMTADHMESAEVLFSDGAAATLGMIDLATSDPHVSGDGQPRVDPETHAGASRYGEFVRAALGIRATSSDAIRRAYPRTWRNSAGYRLNYLLPWSATRPAGWADDEYPPRPPTGKINLAPLLAGSEGTLAVIRRATLRLVPKPKHTVLSIISYDDLAAACDAVPEVLTRGPSAIELVPREIVRLARALPVLGQRASWADERSAAWLVVEFSGESMAALEAAARGLEGRAVIAASSSEQDDVWAVRKAGLGILDSRHESSRSVAFIEDCAIPVERLGDFVRGIQAAMKGTGVEAGIYGHASGGCLHVRPVLDLKSVEGPAMLRAIAQQTLELVLALGGSMASEHGDGIARGEWIRATYGEDVARAEELLKRAADPDGLLAPHKLLDAPSMNTNLRFGEAYRSKAWIPGLDFARNGDLTQAIEQCNGQGVCRKQGGVMCPSFQATREEMHSTRGRANLLRAMISIGGNAAAGSSKRAEEMAYGALDLCLMCNGCSSECPSGVDMAKIKSAFLEHYYGSHRRPLRDYIFGHFDSTARILSALAPAAALFGSVELFRQIAEKTIGVSARRPLPLPVGNRSALKVQKTFGAKQVILVRDPFTHYFDRPTEQAAFDLLGRAGLAVRTPRSIGAGAALISKGFLDRARRQAVAFLDELDGIDPGRSMPLVAIEPSELSAMQDTYRDLLPDASESRMARLEAATSVEAYLQERLDFRGAMRPSVQLLLFHPHCHERAATPAGEHRDRFAGMGLLRACGYSVELVDAGCCGMGGTFGYEAEHYDLSQRIGELALFPAIRAAPGSAVAATGGSCRLQIQQATGAEARHPLVWAARALVPSG